jgi:Putative beta barrel porin-7 (BBP7)
MRIGCVGLLILVATGAGAARAQNSLPAPLALEGTPAQKAADLPGSSSDPDGPIYYQMPGTQSPTPEAGAQAQTPGANAPGAMNATAAGAGTGTGTADPEAIRRARQEKYGRNQPGPNERFWIGGGPLVWRIRKADAPGPLVTQGTAAGGGALGQPDTRVLFGNQPLDFDTFIGARAEAGMWLNCQHTWGAEVGGFILEQRGLGATFASDPNGVPLLARPVTNAITATPLVPAGPIGVVVSSPGILSGGVNVTANSQFYGLETNLLRNLVHCECWNVDLLCGFRYLHLEENLAISSVSTLLPGTGLSPPGTLVFAGANLPIGSTQTVSDRFFTRNQFYGGQIGGRVQYWHGPLFFGLLGKIAFGPNHEVIRISGNSVANTPGGGTQTLPGGLLATQGTRPINNLGPTTLLSTNIGRNTTDWFAVAPEVGVQVGMQFTDHLRAAVGYNYLYLSNVARPGSQVNPLVNPAFVPTSLAFGSPAGPAEPRALTKQENFFAHGLTLNVEFRY